MKDIESPTLLDNVTELVVDDLRERLTLLSSVSVAAASFSIYAYEVLKSELENVEELRFIFNSPTFSTDKQKKERREFFIPKLQRERSLYGSDFEIKLRNKLEQKAIARECADWIRRKVRFKSITTQEHIPGFMHVNGETQSVYQPFDEFTTTGLGCEKGDNIFSMIHVHPSPTAESYLKMFNKLWEDKQRFEDVTDKVLDCIDNVYKENSPEFIYFVTLYNIFNEFLEDISEDVLPNEATGFKTSKIWNTLYNFQKDAVLAIINKLEQYNGCILADSVGLGKTFSALAVIKYYENRNKSVLVLCPKKLNDNWITYNSNYKNNPLSEDRLRYDVFFHSDLSRKEGKTNGRELKNINWGNYDLVVIDESHNFRNGGKLSYGEDDDNPRENRYLKLMNAVIKPGVKTKVLMLSATPVNNGFNDLKNQLQLAYEGDQSKINDKLDISKPIEEIFKEAQKTYNRWTKLPTLERTTQRLLAMLKFDFFEVLDSVTIARSRKHIERYYDTTEIGKFPTRLTPISKRPVLTDIDNAINYSDIAKQLYKLNLAVYAPSFYIKESCRDKYEIDRDDEGGSLGMTGREKGIRRLMAINMLKRLESSVNSFRLTLERVKLLIDNTITKIDNFKQSGADGNLEMADLAANVSMFDEDEMEGDFFVGGKKTRVDLGDMDCLSWKSDMKADQEILELLLLMIKDITPEHDSKLQMLIENLHDKFVKPINGNNKKVIIFTAFSDTADYLYKNLSQIILNRAKLHTGLITGNGVTSTLKRRYDFNDLLTLFSPLSKKKAAIMEDNPDELDVLIATDCISEGQNLQDCDYLINYDIHWNPVRIIQRFGRIDRIGSKNDVIQLVNYWPDIELDEYIKLKGRVENRMKATVLTSTGDDNLLSSEEKGDLEYRKNQLKKLQEEVVDLEDMDTGINIMDLGLNEFRLDLLSYMKDNPDVEHTPYGLHAIVPSDETTPPGAVFILKNRSKSINIDSQNRLHPFYMVYLRDDGEIAVNHLEPKQLLDTLRHLCRGQNEPLQELCASFNRETRNGANMRKYSALLGQAISSIINVKETSDIESFLEGYTGELFTNTPKGLDEFELICFFVVR